MQDDTQAATDKFVEHAALIMRQTGVTVGQARFFAWCEGPVGYANRLEKEDEQDDIL
jgi:hypothetical protein